MLPIIDKPILQYLVEDMVSAGIKDIIFVTAIGKRALEDHFDRNFELEYRLAQKKKKELLKEVEKIGKLANFAFVRQPKPLGDGHAVLQALPFVDDDEPVMVMFGDDLVVDIAKQLVKVYEKNDQSVLSVLEVPKKETHKYGIVGGEWMKKDKLWRATSWVEKPAKGKAPSNLAWPGPAILKPDVWKRLYDKPESAGEIRLAGAYDQHFREGGSMLAHVVNTPRFDCGSKIEYVKAQLYFGLKRPEMRSELKKYIKELI